MSWRNDVCKNVVFFLVLFCGVSCANTASCEEPFRIFVLHSYHEEFPWVRDINEGIYHALSGKGYKDAYGKSVKIPHQMHIYYLDTKRRNSDQYIGMISKKALIEIDKFKPDVVIASDDNVIKFLGKNIIDRGIHLIFCGMNGDPSDYGFVPGKMVSGAYFAGVLERYNYAELIKLVKKLIPKAKSFYIAYDNSTSSKKVVKRFKNEITDLDVKLAGVTMTNSYERWKNVIRSMEGKVDFIMCDFIFTLVDSKGHHVTESDATKWFVETSRLPNFTSTTWQVELGGLGSVAIWGFSQGYEAASMAKEILLKGKLNGPPVFASSVGSIDINQKRADMLGIEIPFDILTYATIH